jgi:hypothetical protein
MGLDVSWNTTRERRMGDIIMALNAGTLQWVDYQKVFQLINLIRLRTTKKKPGVSGHNTTCIAL